MFIHSLSFCFFSLLSPSALCIHSLHAALPFFILRGEVRDGQTISVTTDADEHGLQLTVVGEAEAEDPTTVSCRPRSEEHTSELQARFYLVFRLLLEKKKKKKINKTQDDEIVKE